MIDNGMTVLLLMGLVWFWWDSRGVAERAITAVRHKCEHSGLIFLNDTVAWTKIRLKRNRAGRVQLQRSYFFEFTSDMQQRYHGEIIMLGNQVTNIRLDAYRVG